MTAFPFKANRIVLILFSGLMLTAVCLSQTISVAPTVGPPTTAAAVAGSGFTPNANVRIYFDATRVAVLRSDSSGAFSGTITVPASALPGNHKVRGAVYTIGVEAKTTFLVRTDWTQQSFSSERSGMNPYENILNISNVGRLKTKWTMNLGGIAGWQVVEIGGVAYFNGWDDFVHAVDPATGVELWNYYTACDMDYPPTVADGVLYFGTLYCDFYALDAETGNVLWTYPWPIVGGPAVVNGVVYVNSGNFGDSHVAALDAKTGAELWRTDTSADTITSPAVANGLVFIGDVKGVHALDANNGAIVWDFAAGNLYAHSATVKDGVVYIGSSDGNLYALDAGTGKKLWNYQSGGEASQFAAIANGVVYFGSGDGNAYALDAITGKKLWRTSVNAWANTAPTFANGVVYIASMDNKLYVLNASTGAKIAHYDLGHGAHGISVVNGTVYATAYDYAGGPGYIYAFHLPASATK